MIVNKIGASHLSIGMNMQNFAIISNDGKIKAVADGGSEAKHSEG